MHDLYPYQERLLEALMDGKNVILVIPTGGGKTFAASVPFFQSLAFGDRRLPEKMLYVVPMRVLATQFLATCQELCEEFDPEKWRAIVERYQPFLKDLLSIQTGESPDDAQFEGVAIASTIDQLLASGMGVPYSLPAKLGNINVGAVCSAYLILDEPHQYPLSDEGKSHRGAFTSCLELLRLMKGLNRFVFMSATMSSKLVARLSDLLDATIITADDTERDATGETELDRLNKGRRRTFERASQPMNAESILQQHGRCSLVICNTVQRAMEIYLLLSQAIAWQGRPVELRLLHSLFGDEDRKEQGKELAQLLGKEQWQDGLYQGEQSLIVVATQVVEVGLDISVQVIHSELAPANSLVQRAGRCARFARQQGRVIVYPLPLDDEGKPVSTLPYQVGLCDATWQALEPFSGQVVGFREEQQLIDSVHTASDLDLLERYEKRRDEIQQDITSCLRTSDRKQVTDLIRDINQVQVVIHNDPNSELKIKPWRWQSFGLRPGTLMGKHWERLRACQAELDLPWLCMQCVPGGNKKEQQQQDSEEDERVPTVYEWIPVTNPDEISGAFMLALPNQLATYDKELGFVWLDGRLPLPEEWKQRLLAQNYQSPCHPNQYDRRDSAPTRLQTYEQHLGGLANAYHYALYHEMRYVMEHLEQAMYLDPGTIDHAIQLAIACHDLGKLDRQWQRWVRAWQRFCHEQEGWLGPYKELKRTSFFAKTDYDYRSKKHQQWQKEMREKRPNHACESVMIGRRVLMQSLDANRPASPYAPVVRAVCSAIAHHHTVTACNYGATTIDPAARAAIQRVFEDVRRGSPWSYDLDALRFTFEKGSLLYENVSSVFLTEPDVAHSSEKLLETWLSFLIVRALRLADQRADLYRERA